MTTEVTLALIGSFTTTVGLIITSYFASKASKRSLAAFTAADEARKISEVNTNAIADNTEKTGKVQADISKVAFKIDGNLDKFLKLAEDAALARGILQEKDRDKTKDIQSPEIKQVVDDGINKVVEGVVKGVAGEARKKQ